jgi:CBS domain-containing protein
MLVSHILSVKGREVATIAPEKTLADAARALTRRRIGALIVCTGEGKVAGIVSERDIVGALSVDGAVALDRPVRGYMTSEIATCAEGDAVEDIMETMTNGRFRHVPVMKDGALVGIVSIGDVVKSRIEDAVHEAKALKDYIGAGG